MTDAERRSIETIYSIRRKKSFISNDATHTVTLWKMHGDIDNIKSVSLGFDQYSGSLARLNEYLKGTYKSTSGPACTVHITDKLKARKFDSLSWAELFFRSNVYILGFGMAFSEIDLWWVLNKRARFIKEGHKIQNKIYYLKNEWDATAFYDHDSETEKKRKLQRAEVFAALKIFNVTFKSINTGPDYLISTFKAIE